MPSKIDLFFTLILWFHLISRRRSTRSRSGVGGGGGGGGRGEAHAGGGGGGEGGVGVMVRQTQVRRVAGVRMRGVRVGGGVAGDAGLTAWDTHQTCQTRPHSPSLKQFNTDESQIFYWSQHSTLDK